jgi:hypothetical protein
MNGLLVASTVEGVAGEEKIKKHGEENPIVVQNYISPALSSVDSQVLPTNRVSTHYYVLPSLAFDSNNQAI